LRRQPDPAVHRAGRSGQPHRDPAGAEIRYGRAPRDGEEFLMTAYATELDICPAYGWQGGPELNTRVTSLRNGHERRNARWSQVRHRFVLPLANIENQAYLIDLKATFLAMRGQLHSFLVKDWSDFEAT